MCDKIENNLGRSLKSPKTKIVKPSENLLKLQTRSTAISENPEKRQKSKKMMLRELIRFIKSCLNYKTDKHIACGEIG